MSDDERLPQDGIVSRETIERLQLLERLVQKWNPAINLVSKDSLAHLRERHVNDSLQIYSLVKFDSGVWCDLGSGGGFPGLVVAILMRGSDHQGTLKLVESDARKSVFLREAVRQLDIDATVINTRIEDIPPLSATVLSARALSGLTQLCGFADRHLAADGVALFPKGANYQAEINAAKESWAFDLAVHTSKTDPAAAILELRNIHHV